jgi:hypothetical protein
VQIQLALRFDLPLSIQMSDGSLPPNLPRFAIVFDPVDSGIPPVSGDAKAGWVQNLQAGSYRISARPLFERNYYVARVLVGDTEVTGQAVQLSPASPPIRFIL